MKSLDSKPQHGRSRRVVSQHPKEAGLNVLPFIYWAAYRLLQAGEIPRSSSCLVFDIILAEDTSHALAAALYEEIRQEGATLCRNEEAVDHISSICDSMATESEVCQVLLEIMNLAWFLTRMQILKTLVCQVSSFDVD